MQLFRVCGQLLIAYVKLESARTIVSRGAMIETFQFQLGHEHRRNITVAAVHFLYIRFLYIIKLVGPSAHEGGRVSQYVYGTLCTLQRLPTQPQTNWHTSVRVCTVHDRPRADLIAGGNDALKKGHRVTNSYLRFAPKKCFDVCDLD